MRELKKVWLKILVVEGRGIATPSQKSLNTIYFTCIYKKGENLWIKSLKMW